MKISGAILSLAIAGAANAFAPSASFARKSSTLSMSVLSTQTGQSSLDPSVTARYENLPIPGDKILAEYVWVDAEGNTRSKTRTLPEKKCESVDTLPKWNFDGSSTDQAPGDDSEVILNPCRIFNDPFRIRPDGKNNILVMCDTYTPAGEPLPSNTRAKGKKLFFTTFYLYFLYFEIYEHLNSLIFNN